jgi:RNA polymerase sigma-70 factor (ECF subfamily)
LILKNSDERLIAEYVAGDDRAFTRLIERHRDSVAQFARRRLGSWSLWADDVTQDVFLRVAQAARRFEGRSTVRTWLFGIALLGPRTFRTFAGEFSSAMRTRLPS